MKYDEMSHFSVIMKNIPQHTSSYFNLADNVLVSSSDSHKNETNLANECMHARALATTTMYDQHTPNNK